MLPSAKTISQREPMLFILYNYSHPVVYISPKMKQTKDAIAAWNILTDGNMLIIANWN
jgi:hypothetical protein